ncbi:MAG: MIP/aquaporin family protein [Thermoleophilia bacterium]
MTVPYPTRLVAELLGTFGFFFFGFSGIAASVDQPTAISAAGVAAGFGLGLALMIFAFGHLSGGHFNPAVTLGLVAGRRFPLAELPGYWLAQFVGGVVAAAAAATIYSDRVQDALPNHAAVGDGPAFLAEAIATALFVIVISAVATDARAAWSPGFAPIAIGGFIFTAALVVGPFTSGSFNPARSLAPAVLAGDGHQLWIFIVAPLVGGLVGGLIYLFVRLNSGETQTA